eukprot:58958-Alexandrium_andersonii.AAC.1
MSCAGGRAIPRLSRTEGPEVLGQKGHGPRVRASQGRARWRRGGRAKADCCGARRAARKKL